MPTANPQEIITAAKRRVADLQAYQLPRLRDCKGPVDLQRELSAELKEDIRRVKRSIDTLDAVAYEQETEREKERYLGICRELSQELDTVHRMYREALLESTRKIKTASSEQYELVPEKTPEIAGTPVSGQGQDDALQTKTNEVTDALRRTAANMRAELERLYDTYSNLLTTSTRLVKQIERADWYDKLIIFLALGLFFLVVAFIIKRRVLDKAVRGVGWWVGGSYKLLTGRGRGGKSSGKALKGAVKRGKQAVQVVSTYASSVSSSLPTSAEVTDIMAVATTAITLPPDERIRNEL
ncbi:hypothetical protein QFC22_003874 [Naganishia vaughanmartiniae]|uniref:Uncharacterized protein n=1 Tax=Naganishia vaughanmartiniae TaxID=1424756 RepID=A0ACC2X5J8_9TREE|nr:hypothetical protein QFC22_003874 [Naganishia vaughanmartiniae]